jgi:hypothetical protein
MGARRSLIGFLLFRDPSPPRAEAFAPLTAAGFQIAKARDAGGAEWALDLTHERWGHVRVGVMRGSGSAPPAAVFEPDDDLLPEDLTALRHARSSVLVEQKDGSDRPLSDRKRFLAVLAALARCGALMAVDVHAQKAWSHDALDEELASDADVDVTALYRMHAVSRGGHHPIWLHTHGLSDLGLVDFDVLRAARQLLTLDDTAIRALAFAILEGRLRADGTPFSLASPEGDIALVAVSDFTLQAAPEDLALRDDKAQEGHTDDRGIVCEVRLEELAPFLPAVPAGLLMQELRPDQTFQFSSAASQQMSVRARATLGSALRSREAHPDLDLPLLVKIALATSSGGLEHVWVRASLAGGEAIDGELLVQPHGVPGWSKGMRGRWPTSSVSGWHLQTPFGNASPHSFGPLRRLRANPEEARRRVARARTRSPS